MNPLIKKLGHIAGKKNRLILGLMSGTSMDGLDIALCNFSGSGRNTTFELEHFSSLAYPLPVRHQLIDFSTAECLNPQLLCIWNTHLAQIHADYINKVLNKWGVDKEDVDLVASHGQTLYHAPKHKHKLEGMPNATLQIGDGDHIAARTGLITISDFRQRDTARGNEGAPLAAYGDYLLFSKHDTHRILLNIGGISNFTCLEAGSDLFPPVSLDTGPGNTLIDAAVRKFFDGMEYDNGGSIAARGNVHVKLLQILQNHPYFSKPPPKTTGLEVFHLNWVERCMSDNNIKLSAIDLVATLTRLTIETIAEQIRQVLRDSHPAEILVSGGGVHNASIMKGLAEKLSPVPVFEIDIPGVSADAKEALIFAALANELVCGKNSRLHFGKISLPDF